MTRHILKKRRNGEDIPYLITSTKQNAEAYVGCGRIKGPLGKAMALMMRNNATIACSPEKMFCSDTPSSLKTK
jgi:hypothetical protein